VGSLNEVDWQCSPLFIASGQGPCPAAGSRDLVVGCCGPRLAVVEVMVTMVSSCTCERTSIVEVLAVGLHYGGLSCDKWPAEALTAGGTNGGHLGCCPGALSRYSWSPPAGALAIEGSITWGCCPGAHHVIAGQNPPDECFRWLEHPGHFPRGLSRDLSLMPAGARALGVLPPGAIARRIIT
jgi:hypothetical protein